MYALEVQVIATHKHIATHTVLVSMYTCRYGI